MVFIEEKSKEGKPNEKYNTKLLTLNRARLDEEVHIYFPLRVTSKREKVELPVRQLLDS